MVMSLTATPKSGAVFCRLMGPLNIHDSAGAVANTAVVAPVIVKFVEAATQLYLFKTLLNTQPGLIIFEPL